MSCSKTLGTIGSVILFILAAIFVIFGFLFILGSGSSQGQASWVGTGIILMIIGFVLVAAAFGAIWLSHRKAAGQGDDKNVTYKIDLPGNVNMDVIKCKSCGGTITQNDIQMVAGAPVVTCPYCHTTYQLTEEPKW